MSGNLPDEETILGVRCTECRDVFRSEDAVQCWTCKAWRCKAHALEMSGDWFCTAHWPQAARDYIEALESDTKALVQYRWALILIAAGGPVAMAGAALDGEAIPEPSCEQLLMASITKKAWRKVA